MAGRRGGRSILGAEYWGRCSRGVETAFEVCNEVLHGVSSAAGKQAGGSFEQELDGLVAVGRRGGLGGDTLS